LRKGYLMFCTVLDASNPTFRAEFSAWLGENRSPGRDADVTDTVGKILDDVRNRGDEALLEWTRTLDGFTVTEASALEIPIEQVWEAVEITPPELLEAIEHAHERIEAYHSGLIPEARHPLGDDGPAYQRIIPLKRVGVYVPGGRASYPSSVLMCVTPAKVAGVDEVIMVSPASAGGLPTSVLAAAAIAGVDRVFTLGGAQAIGALTFGTETVPSVDKIVGPGNRYVAEAKRQVFGQVGIDMIAGPSEILVVLLDPEFSDLAASDLLAQAEHDPSAVPMVLVSNVEQLDRVRGHLQERLSDLPRADIARTSLEEKGLALVVPDRSIWAAICDEIAAEHLELLGAPDQASGLASEISNAGAVFVGAHSPEALGDYVAGPAHVLPTAGTARFVSPLGPEDFCRRMSVLRFNGEELRALADTVCTLARAEGLEGHARSIEARIVEPD
jgi:histidinol dehydrogenase